MSTRDIINQRQADLLQALANAGRLLGPQLMAAAGTGDRNLYYRNMLDLRERGLALAERDVQRVWLSATAAGLQALHDHHTARLAADYGTATPARTNWISADSYTPTPQRAYYRNNGNTHIASRGVGC